MITCLMFTQKHFVCFLLFAANYLHLFKFSAVKSKQNKNIEYETGDEIDFGG